MRIDECCHSCHQQCSVDAAVPALSHDADNHHFMCCSCQQAQRDATAASLIPYDVTHGSPDTPASVSPKHSPKDSRMDHPLPTPPRMSESPKQRDPRRASGHHNLADQWQRFAATTTGPPATVGPQPPQQQANLGPSQQQQQQQQQATASDSAKQLVLGLVVPAVGSAPEASTISDQQEEGELPAIKPAEPPTANPDSRQRWWAFEQKQLKERLEFERQEAALAASRAAGQQLQQQQPLPPPPPLIAGGAAAEHASEDLDRPSKKRCGSDADGTLGGTANSYDGRHRKPSTLHEQDRWLLADDDGRGTSRPSHSPAPSSSSRKRPLEEREDEKRSASRRGSSPHRDDRRRDERDKPATSDRRDERRDERDKPAASDRRDERAKAASSDRRDKEGSSDRQDDRDKKDKAGLSERRGERSKSETAERRPDRDLPETAERRKSRDEGEKAETSQRDRVKAEERRREYHVRDSAEAAARHKERDKPSDKRRDDDKSVQHDHVRSKSSERREERDRSEAKASQTRDERDRSNSRSRLDERNKGSSSGRRDELDKAAKDEQAVPAGRRDERDKAAKDDKAGTAGRQDERDKIAKDDKASTAGQRHERDKAAKDDKASTTSRRDERDKALKDDKAGTAGRQDERDKAAKDDKAGTAGRRDDRRGGGDDDKRKVRSSSQSHKAAIEESPNGDGHGKASSLSHKALVSSTGHGKVSERERSADCQKVPASSAVHLLSPPRELPNSAHTSSTPAGGLGAATSTSAAAATKSAPGVQLQIEPIPHGLITSDLPIPSPGPSSTRLADPRLAAAAAAAAAAASTTAAPQAALPSLMPPPPLPPPPPPPPQLPFSSLAATSTACDAPLLPCAPCLAQASGYAGVVADQPPPPVLQPWPPSVPLVPPPLYLSVQPDMQVLKQGWAYDHHTPMVPFPELQQPLASHSQQLQGWAPPPFGHPSLAPVAPLLPGSPPPLPPPPPLPGVLALLPELLALLAPPGPSPTPALPPLPAHEDGSSPEPLPPGTALGIAGGDGPATALMSNAALVGPTVLGSQMFGTAAAANTTDTPLQAHAVAGGALADLQATVSSTGQPSGDLCGTGALCPAAAIQHVSGAQAPSAGANTSVGVSRFSQASAPATINGTALSLQLINQLAPSDDPTGGGVPNGNGGDVMPGDRMFKDQLWKGNLAIPGPTSTVVQRFCAKVVKRMRTELLETFAALPGDATLECTLQPAAALPSPWAEAYAHYSPAMTQIEPTAMFLQRVAMKDMDGPFYRRVLEWLVKQKVVVVLNTGSSTLYLMPRANAISPFLVLNFTDFHICTMAKDEVEGVITPWKRHARPARCAIKWRAVDVGSGVPVSEAVIQREAARRVKWDPIEHRRSEEKPPASIRAKQKKDSAQDSAKLNRDATAKPAAADAEPDADATTLTDEEVMRNAHEDFQHFPPCMLAARRGTELRPLLPASLNWSVQVLPRSPPRPAPLRAPVAARDLMPPPPSQGVVLPSALPASAGHAASVAAAAAAAAAPACAAEYAEWTKGADLLHLVTSSSSHTARLRRLLPELTSARFDVVKGLRCFTGAVPPPCAASISQQVETLAAAQGLQHVAGTSGGGLDSDAAPWKVDVVLLTDVNSLKAHRPESLEEPLRRCSGLGTQAWLLHPVRFASAAPFLEASAGGGGSVLQQAAWTGESNTMGVTLVLTSLTLLCSPTAELRRVFDLLHKGRRRYSTGTWAAKMRPGDLDQAMAFCSTDTALAICEAQASGVLVSMQDGDASSHDLGSSVGSSGSCSSALPGSSAAPQATPGMQPVVSAGVGAKKTLLPDALRDTVKLALRRRDSRFYLLAQPTSTGGLDGAAVEQLRQERERALSSPFLMVGAVPTVLCFLEALLWGVSP